jgi:hypothetical protein
MALSLTTPNVGMVALVVGTFLLGNQLGGELARRREIKEEIRDIQRQHKEMLAQMDSVHKAALRQDAQALEQVQAIYSLLNQLDIKEVQVRSNLAVAKKRIEDGQKETQRLQTEVKKAAEKSAFTFYEDN